MFETTERRHDEHANCCANPCEQCRIVLIDEILAEEALVEMLIAWLKVFA